MEEYTQITLNEWVQWKEEIREKLRETAGNFVYIGYRLKQIRDSGMYDGAADIFEFAQKEYGLGKSTVSRFIAINEKFSEGGNSLELKSEYRAIGSSKLAEMLTLTDAECQMITERTTVKEIRDLKNFTRQQAPDAEEEQEEKVLSPTQKCMIDFFKDKGDILNKAIKAIYHDQLQDAAEIINPSGYATHKKGICYLFMYDYVTGVKAKILTQPEPISMSWRDLLYEIYDIYSNVYEGGADDVHKAYYGTAENVDKTQQNQGLADSVATSQQEEKREEKEEENNAVTVAEKVEREEEKEENPGNEAAENEESLEESGKPEADMESADNEAGADVTESCEEAAGVSHTTTEIETEIHEVETENREIETENHETETESDENETPDDEDHTLSFGGSSPEDKLKLVVGYKGAIKNTLNIMQHKYSECDWPGLIDKAKDIIWRAEQMIKLEDK